MGNSPLIWFGANAKLLCSGTILKADGSPLVSGGSTYAQVTNYAALPDPTTTPANTVMLVMNSTGFWGINRKSAGLWGNGSNGSGYGVAWVWIDDAPTTSDNLTEGTTNLFFTALRSAIQESNTYATPQTITTSLPVPTALWSRVYITGTVTAPTIASGAACQSLQLVGAAGCSILLQSNSNLKLSGDCLVSPDTVITLDYVGSKWLERCRNEI